MGKFLHTQNSFANGEVSQEFFAREMAGGLSKLENMDVLPGGGIARRKGLARIADADDNATLIPFSVSETENYLLSVSGGRLKIYSGDEFLQALPVPWAADDLQNIQYAQRFGTMIFVHPDYRPQVLKKTDSMFFLSDFNFSSNDDMSSNIPFMKFDDSEGIRLTITTHPNGNNFATVTASSAFWKPENANGRLFFLGKQWTVYSYVSPTVVVAATNGTYSLPGYAISDWREAAFGTRRGWPRSITFHQNRLVFGGSRDWPAGVWMSRVGNHYNFNPGTGLDDEAIFLTLLSEKRQQICTIVSSNDLQILTTAGEWAISNKPLIPASVNIRQHTSIGSVGDRYLQPQKCDGNTIFIARGESVREIALDEIGENYKAVDLCALSKHLVKFPTDLAFNDLTGQLFMVMANGEISVLHKNATTGINAWGTYKTNGEFKSVAVLNGETFVSVSRPSGTFIEKFSETEFKDSGEFDFSFSAMGLPLISGKHAPKKIRIKKLTVRLKETRSISICGQRALVPNEKIEVGFSGDVSVNFLGVTGEVMEPLWELGGTEPMPATVLSVTIDGWYLI